VDSNTTAASSAGERLAADHQACAEQHERLAALWELFGDPARAANQQRLAAEERHLAKEALELSNGQRD
jgi:hypothetical protein